ncbi:MAG: phosphoribosylformylglycinamidine cyclo-ligase [Phycisphaerae bacterium]|nr:phosphoribosylformylglycinamidine cyclo-ligase [Phycisphaerae bacterium]
MRDGATYRRAGVDIDAADATKREMAGHLEATDPRVLNRLGAFASLFEASFPGIERPVLVLKAEEPGSKQLLAVRHGRIRGIAYDLVNHLIDDIIVMGAAPLAVLDTIICGKLDRPTIIELVGAMAEACRDQGCTLVGGETSEQPGVVPEDRFVLCASVVGVVDRSRIIDGSRIRKGDVVLGLASNGLHTNGYSLVRHLLDSDSALAQQPVGDRTFLDAVLEPHRCYYQGLRDLFGREELHGLAHITGGGIAGNLNRVLPEGLGASIDLGAIRPLPIFASIRRAGNVPDADMLRTFNMGVGIALVADPGGVDGIREHLSARGYGSERIGEIVAGDRTVQYRGELAW